jgi:protein-S-isoprenylcysteine O-methyltransferase Ste14
MLSALATLLVASFFLINGLQERAFRRKGLDTQGAFPVARPLFLLGKLSMLLAWLGIVVQAYIHDLRVIDAGAFVPWFALGVEALGIATIALSYRHLGDNNQMGLTQTSVTLHTTGIYALSRNPVYVGFHLMTLSAVLFTLNPVVLVLALVAVGVHHAVVLAEEAHLERQAGEAYREYRRRVRRYI